MKHLVALMALALMLPLAGPANAAGYPDRPIRLVVPFPAGSGTDVVGRILGETMSQDLGQPFIIDNKGGAQGIIGVQTATNAPADGYTLVILGVTTGASNVSLFKKLPYDPARDLTMIGMVGDSPIVLVASPKLPVKNAADLLDLARREPGKLTYGYGSGSAQIALAKLVAMGDIKALPVPYKGSPQVMTDLIAGQIDFTMTDISLAVPQMKGGTINALGVTSKDRFPLLPELPSINESGAKGYDLVVWFALGAPAKLPEPIVERLSAALKKALASPDLIRRFAEQGLAPKFSTPAQASSFIKSEIVEWGKLIKQAGIEPQE
ncbi:tripartite tricarboxylate transporter substrate binding protein [soil metagenome]